jgi:transcriptional regulator with XRE-family HTH domain
VASYIERFGKHVRKVREDKNWSQEVLAKEAGLHRTAVSLIERGKRAVTLRTIYLLATALEIEPADLVPSRAKGKDGKYRPELFDDSEIE